MHFSRIHLLSPSAVWTCHPRWTCSKFRVPLTSKTEYYLTSQERCGCSSQSSPARGPQDEKIKNRSRRNKAADSEGGRRSVPTRGNRRGERADEVERFGRAILVPVQSIVGDRGPLDPSDTESVFPQASQIWRNPVFAGFVETAARREAEENGPPWGAEESAFAEVGAGSRISPDRKRPPALSRPAGPRAMGKCLGRRGSPALDPRARSMRPAARVTALIPLRHMYSLLRFPRIDALTSSATPRSR